MSEDYFDKAVREIGIKPIVDVGGREVHVIGLLRSPPLVAKWWKGKQVSVIGVDVDGNFFLRHPDGSVRYWQHSQQTESWVTGSVREFIRGFREDVNGTLRWWERDNGNASGE